ncbi:MAG TPA: DEAD/DEAH box helicase [Thiobacillaceae bacterium]|nr:DEAD/DEAH box helicase [Thiobacillaceae bacterium]
MTFESLALNPFILKALTDSGYTEPTPVQAQAIPIVMAGHDLMASAQTGTGKTAAFMLPALHKLSDPPKAPGKGPRILVLSPTRELAQQITAAATRYGKYLRRAKCVSILGGMPYPVQNRLLASPVDILVATPGRLIDHMQRGKVDFSRLEMLVLDEADRMLDMGFIEDVETIARATPNTRQTLLFSATLDGKIAQVAKNLLRDPKRVEVASQRERHENIEQRLHFCDNLDHKNRILDHLLRDVGLNQALVFTATKRDADQLADDLYQQGFPAAALHGDMHQGARNRTLTKLRRGEIRVLVATDVAARGIDVAGISHVINFDLPKQAEDYVHRIGRTGRAGASGVAVSLVSSRDGLQLRRISHFTGHNIQAHVIPGLEPKTRMRAEAPRPDKGGKRRSPQEFKSGFKPRSGERTHGKPEAAFAGPSERRHQERYAPQPDIYRPGDGNRAARTSGRPARKFDK